MLVKTKRLLLLLVALLLALSAPLASAAARHWTGAAGTNWTTAANWSNNVAPVAGDILIFPSGAANRTNFNNYANGTAFNHIEMATVYTLSGNRILLANGLSALSLVSPTMTVNNNLTLSANQTFRPPVPPSGIPCSSCVPLPAVRSHF